jgi:hypothetical protein
VWDLPGLPEDVDAYGKRSEEPLPGPFSAFSTADHNLLENVGRFPQPLGKLGPPVGRLARLFHSSHTCDDDDNL